MSNQTAYIYQKNPNSDRDLKADITYSDGRTSYENILRFTPATFVYKDDPSKRVRRGVIAQDMYAIDPEYVKIVPAQQISPEEAAAGAEQNDDTLALDTNPILLDTLIAVRYLAGLAERQQEIISGLEKRLAVLEDGRDARQEPVN